MENRKQQTGNGKPADEEAPEDQIAGAPSAALPIAHFPFPVSGFLFSILRSASPSATHGSRKMENRKQETGNGKPANEEAPEDQIAGAPSAALPIAHFSFPVSGFLFSILRSASPTRRAQEPENGKPQTANRKWKTG